MYRTFQTPKEVNVIDELVPGLTIHINALEGHCLLAVLRSALPYLPQDHPMWSWLEYLGAEERRYEAFQRGENIAEHTGIAGASEEERVFLEGLIARECAYLTELIEAGERWRETLGEQVGCWRMGFLPCGDHPKMHLDVLRAWLEREILGSKPFSETRRLLGQLSPSNLPSIWQDGKPVLALSDFERFLREAFMRWDNQRQREDERAMEDFDAHADAMREQAQRIGLTFEEARARYVGVLERVRQTARAAREQHLRARHTILDERVEIVSLLP